MSDWSTIERVGIGVAIVAQTILIIVAGPIALLALVIWLAGLLVGSENPL